MPIILAVGRNRQEDFMLKTSLSYITTSGLKKNYFHEETELRE
jgi:hypothetical protein